MPRVSKEVEEHQHKLIDMVVNYCDQYPDVMDSAQLLDFAGRLMVTVSQMSECPTGVVVRVSGVEYMTMCRALSPEEVEIYYKNNKQ